MTKQVKKWLPILLLLLYPLRHATLGLDLMDAGYSLGNYRYFSTMNPVWKIATYLANVTGMLLMKLPYGSTWVGMNVYTALLLGITAAVTYRFLTQKLGHPILVFVGELLALSLCWAPTTILYHYMGYYAMTAAVILLFQAITEHKKVFYIIAGVIIGLSVCVRMPNITYVALIFPVWYAAWCHHDRDWLTDTLRCIGGFLTGFLVPLGVISFRYGADAYPDMITSLFGMTDTATDYKPTAMVTAMLGDYAVYSVWLLLFLLYCIAGVILFKIQAGRWETAKKLLYLLGMAVLVRFCYGRGMFGIDYQDYFSIYKCVTVFLLLVILLCVFVLVSRRMGEQHKLWSAFLLVIIFVTPLGSNNGIYPLINNLFLVAPVAFWLMHGVNIEYHMLFNYPVKATITVICLGTLFQSTLFGLCFVFHDTTQNGEQRVEAVITGSQVTTGMYAGAGTVAALDRLGTYLSEQDLLEKQVLLYGNIPAVSYIFDMEPAVYTTWADLDSNTIGRLKADLDAITDEVPVIIVSKEVGEAINGDAGTEDPKLEVIAAFMERHGYVCAYTNECFCVYTLPN